MKILWLGDVSECNDNFNYLVILIESDLNFSYHIDTICKKIATFIGVMYRAQYIFFLNFQIVSQILCSIIYSHGLIVNGCTPKNFLSKSLLEQKKVLRTVGLFLMITKMLLFSKSSLVKFLKKMFDQQQKSLESFNSFSFNTVKG